MGARQLLTALALTGALVWPRLVTAEMSFIPVPEIVTDPNEGNTAGLLAVFLFLDQQGEVQYMLAPDATYNSTKGFFPNFRFFGYPTPTRRYSVVIGKSTTKDEDYEVEFTDRGLWDGRAFVLMSAVHEKDSTERFYGFGNSSHQIGESNYTSNNTVAQVTPGVWLLPNINLTYRMRIHRFSVEQGQVDSLPFIGVDHPEVRDRGLDGGVYWAHRVALTYDSRDERDITTRGALALVYTEAADRALGSMTSFVKFGGEWRDFVPIYKGNPILALRALADYTSGASQTAFWELNSLGGRRLLRGFGGDRFVDFNRSLASAEVRTNVWNPHIFGVNAEIELAPFLEAGQVFPRVTQSPVRDLHWVYGLGFRGLVRPQIVGFVDIGRSFEGNAIFTGVDYPF
jgi:hypothetical protein